MPTRKLPPSPNLAHLKSQAAELLAQHRRGEPQALQRLREFHPGFAGLDDASIAGASLTWSDALFAIAREYGFRSWPRLKARVEAPDARADRPHHERVGDAAMRQAIELMDDGDLEGLRAHLERHPGLAHRRAVFEGENYFTNPGLIGFIAENPTRHEAMPPNSVEIARAILDAGAKADREAVTEALALVASSRVARDNGHQAALIALLCGYGADPDPAMLPALAHGEFAAARALIDRGARLDLPAAAALGRDGDATALLPGSTGVERHLALALAAQFGREEIVRLLLDAGETTSRYNPPGAHAHATPLHQAALEGHEGTVRLLLERGARRDLRDTLFQGTPADWARHGGRDRIAALIETRP